MKRRLLLFGAVCMLSMTLPIANHLFNPPMDFESLTRFYQDLDGDGYGNPLMAIHSTIQPDGYVPIDGDCNDQDKKITSGILFYYYPDLDGDGVGEFLYGIRACSQPKGYVLNYGDCDDHDASVGKGFLNNYYRDLDEDGYGDYNFVKQACQVPKGYVEIKAFEDHDCDDTDPTIGKGKPLILFPDEDGDGLGNGREKRFFCSAPKGWVENRSDCNDHDPKIGKGEFHSYFKDYDEDGYGDPKFQMIACEAPKGFVSESSDCNDNDKSIGPGFYTFLYIDKDHDGLGDPSYYIYTCQIPDGFVGNFDDCDDTNSKIGIKQVFYLDKDRDGFGGDDAEFACTPSKGYISIQGDCNDSDPTINPNTKEVCNNIDDNCNGTIDETNVAASITNVPSYLCSYEQPIVLNGIPAGGKFYIDKIPQTVLDPAAFKIDGAHTVEYAVMTEGCLTRIFTQFKKIEVKQPLIYNLNDSYYQNDLPFVLFGNSLYGVFSIDGIKTKVFNPSLLAIGKHSVTYTNIEVACKAEINRMVSILSSNCPLHPISYQCYQIINKKSKKVLTVRKASGDDGAIVVQTEFEDLNNQKWFIYPAENGTYSLFATHSFKQIVAKTGNVGSAVIQKEFTYPFPFGSWKIECTDYDGFYKIVNPENNYVLDIMARSTASDAQVITWYWTHANNQYWEIKPVDCSSTNNITAQTMETRENEPSRNKHTIKVFPNPSDDFIILEGNEIGNQSLKILDPFGRIHLSAIIPENQNSIRINLNKIIFNPGVYIIQIGSDNSLVSKKIIIK